MRGFQAFQLTSPRIKMIKYIIFILLKFILDDCEDSQGTLYAHLASSSLT